MNEGDRVESVDGFQGVVRYVGPIEGTEPAEGWFGVEWDDGSRGKHDGTAHGKRYFQALLPTSGSFVRADKLVPNISFQEAVIAKYASPDASSAEDRMAFRDKARGKAEIVAILVGKEKIEEFLKKLKPLQILTLRGMGICSPGDLLWVEENLLNCTDVDLSKNLFSRLDDVARISTALRRLESLTLSDNKFSNILLSAAAPGFATVKVLVLNQTRVSWDEIQKIEEHLPSLESLQLCANEISTLSPLGEGRWKVLTALDLTGNKLSRWEDVLTLARLPRLQRLNLKSNGISTVFSCEIFQTLKFLCVSENAIIGWHQVDKITGFPLLNDLRITNNPFLEGIGAGEARQEVIARVGGLKGLNGSDVRPRERDDAEKLYITKCILSAGSADAVSPTQHPRFASLLAHWGAPPLPQTSGGAAAESMCEVSIRSDVAASMTKPHAKKKLPISMSVSALKRVCQALYGLDASRQNLFLRREGDDFPTALSDDMKPLAFYGISPGSTIVVTDAQA